VPNSLLEIGGFDRDTYWDGHACLGVTHSSQASAEHFQQRAEFLPLRDRGLGPLAIEAFRYATTGGRRNLHNGKQWHLCCGDQQQ